MCCLPLSVDSFVAEHAYSETDSYVGDSKDLCAATEGTRRTLALTAGPETEGLGAAGALQPLLAAVHLCPL